MNRYLDVAPEVQEAIKAGKPVVALESTIISHGMPYPQNVETALNVEKIIRDGGAVPATIAIIGGRLKAGLTPEEIDYLGKTGAGVTKASRRDLPILVKAGCGGDYRLDAPAQLAEAFHVKRELGLRGGMLVTNPIPEAYSMDADVINKALDEAVEEAKAQGIHGKATTPFLLAKIKDITGGDSLAANIQLVYNNAKLATATACELAKLKK